MSNETLKRITPEEVIEAFKVTGLKPMQGQYFQKDSNDGRTCACGLGAVYHMNNNGIAVNYVVADYFEDILGRQYSVGFACGFDNMIKTAFNDEYNIGQEDGIAARLALVEKGMM